MRRFHLYRSEDVTGVSGKGTIAEGVEWSDGAVALRWYGATPSTIVYNSVDDMIAVHGHHGKTEIVWQDEKHD